MVKPRVAMSAREEHDIVLRGFPVQSWRTMLKSELAIERKPRPTADTYKRELQSTLYSNRHYEIRDFGSKSCYERFTHSTVLRSVVRHLHLSSCVTCRPVFARPSRYLGRAGKASSETRDSNKDHNRLLAKRLRAGRVFNNRRRWQGLGSTQQRR